MQIVIEISDEDYKDIIENGLCGYSSVRENVSNAIFLGKPLPKNHGRLIDAMKLKSAIFGLTITNNEFGEGLDATVNCINNAPTIIEEVKADATKS